MRNLARLSLAAFGAFGIASMLWCAAAVSNAALGVGPAASAQATGGSPGRGAQRFAKMLMSIRPPLSDAQKDQIRKMREDMRKQYHDQPPPADPEARRARFRAFMDKIRGVLNLAQQRDFDAKMQAMRNRQGQGQGQAPH